MYVHTGTYTGNGITTSSRSHLLTMDTGITLVPSVVILWALRESSPPSSPSTIWWKTTDMAADASSKMRGVGNSTTTGIDGFAGGVGVDGSISTSGNAAAANANGHLYFWVALGDTLTEPISGNLQKTDFSDHFDYGVYTGDGNDSRDITTTMQPDFVFIGSTNPAAIQGWAWFSTKSGDNALPWFDNSSFGANRIQTVGATSFQIGSDVGTNTDTATYHWFALKITDGTVVQGTYNGDGNDDRAITYPSSLTLSSAQAGLSAGAQAIFTKIERAANLRQCCVCTASSEPLSQTPEVNYGVAAVYSDMIQDVNPSTTTFQVGTNEAANEATDTPPYHYLALASSPLFAFPTTGTVFPVAGEPFMIPSGDPYLLYKSQLALSQRLLNMKLR